MGRNPAQNWSCRERSGRARYRRLGVPQYTCLLLQFQVKQHDHLIPFPDPFNFLEKISLHIMVILLLSRVRHD